ncbi:MAG: asparaginase [Thermoleophilaceae bacterium]|nr:asparaginase [Thermoleophilaceae bacterium]
MGHRIGMVATGGTISMRRGDEGKAHRPELGAASLVSMLDEGAHVADVEVTMYEPHRIPSEDLSFSLLSNLARTIEQALTENDSVIVTHGTDTMEDAAFFVAEALGNPDVIFTGSMLPSDHPEYDGISNLTASFIVARSDESMGTIICMYRYCLPAWSALKRDSAAMDAFNIREGKAVGRLIENEVERITARPTANWINDYRILDDRDPIVPILTLGVGTSPDALELMTSVAKGIVIETTGTGSVPSSMKQAIIDTANAIPVVITTRCANGPTIAQDVYPNKWDELIESGIHFENHLDSYKARTRLILSISLAREYEPFHVTPI